MTDREAGAGPSPMARRMAEDVIRKSPYDKPIIDRMAAVIDRELAQFCVLPRETVEKAALKMERAHDRLRLKAQMEHEENCGGSRDYRRCGRTSCTMALAENLELADALSALRRALEKA